MGQRLSKREKDKKVKNGKFSAPNFVLLTLNRMVNCPFEILLESGKIKNQLRPSSTKSAVYRLQKRNLIFAERRGKKILFALTEEGAKEAEKIKFKFTKPNFQKWDGKWRVIIFDIPEKLRGKRDLLRKELVGFGFMQLQKSVWAYPNSLPNEFIDFWREAGILKHCVIFEADRIENGKNLEKFFFNKV
ncbi:hypothetical protein HYS99_00830 [Candidatus Giovannonibacteria bacterium]|nr:hypothetical protein [Candidatus Giovannonibacteria bacterium]